MKKDNTLLELLAGIILSGAVMQAVLAAALKDYVYHAAGLWSGVAVACVWAVHMKRSIEDTLELGEAGAERRARSAYFARMLIAAVLLGVVLYFHLGSPPALVAGVLSLKISAYVNPLVHRVFVWLQSRRNRK